MARFHLKNGARLERINLFANRSQRGIRQSLGMMVYSVYDLNRVYDLNQVEQNHVGFTNFKRVAAGNRLSKLTEQIGLKA